MLLRSIIFLVFVATYVQASHFACVLFRQFTAYSIMSKAYLRSDKHPTNWSAGWDTHPGIVKTFNTKFQGNRIETDGNYKWFEVWHTTGYWGRFDKLGHATSGPQRNYYYKCADTDNNGYCSNEKVKEYLKDCMEKI